MGGAAMSFTAIIVFVVAVDALEFEVQFWPNVQLRHSIAKDSLVR